MEKTKDCLLDLSEKITKTSRMTIVSSSTLVEDAVRSSNKTDLSLTFCHDLRTI